MRKGWKSVAFSTAPVQIIDGDRGKNYPKQTDFSDLGYCVFLNTGNVTESGLSFSSVQFISEEKDDALRKGKLKRNDVFMTTRGTIGNVAHYNKKIPFDHMRINSGMVIFRCDQSQLSPLFLYHFLRSPNFHGQANALRSGVAQPQLPIRDINRITLPLPSIDEQSRIANFISNFDDLIENARRRIQLLEQSARLLYKEWFVRLRFPGYEHVKIKDGVPEGWERIPLSAICFEVRDAVRPDQVEPSTPYIGLEHIPRRSITLNEWGYAEDVESSKFRFAEGDILFGKIRPYFHKVGFAITEGITSSDSIVIRANRNELTAYCLALISSDQFIAVASKTVKEGSKMPRADWKFMRQYPILLPVQSVLLSFNQFFDNIKRQLKILALQGQNLSKARDLLLPRLMNGEIEV
jgi:type I restriction enzyme S subunit